MTSTTEIESRPSEDGDAFYDAHHIAMINRVFEARAAGKQAKSDEEMPAQILKSYLAEQDEKVLYDEERGLKAFLQERSGTEWDLRGADLQILRELQVIGALKVDNALFDAHRKNAPTTLLDEAARFRRQIAGSVALFVEKVK